MVGIQVISDLHLEIERPSQPDLLYEFTIPVKSELLALLGDIGWTRDDRLFQWLRRQLANFKIVFFVAGNHEPYWSSLTESRQRLEQFTAELEAERSTSDPQLGRLVVLDKTRFDLSDTVTILGCTLWANLDSQDFDFMRVALNDFRRIEGFTPFEFRSLHQQDLAWLNSNVQKISTQEPHRKIMILTHHAPTVPDTGDPKFDGGPTNSAFATELVGEPCWNAEQVKIWAFGHTHWCCDFVRDGIRVFSNQRGYKEAGPLFDPRTVLEL